MKPFDENGAFRHTVDREGLRRLAVQAAGVTLLSQVLGTAVQMIATVTLARLLTPADFGLLGMVTTFSLLFVNVGLNGFTEAVLQRHEIDHFLASNLFWINLSLGLFLAIGFVVAAPLLAWLYNEPRVAAVASAVAVTILFTSVSVLHLALLKRAMRFSVISANDMLARAVSVAMSIILAKMGWGYWALVAGVVAQPLATSAGALALCRWAPGLPRRVVDTVPTVRFAMNTYGRFLMDYFSRNLDNLLVGWRFGPEALGAYKKAYDMGVLPTNLFSSPLTGVAVSTLSRFNRDPVQCQRVFLSSLSTLAFVGMGLGGSLTLVGKDLIVLLLGPLWETSGRILTFFGPGIGFTILHASHGWILLSMGRADRWLRWGLVEFSVMGVLFLTGLAWGPVGIAVAWTASFWVLTIPSLWYGASLIHLGVAALVAVVWKYVLAAAIAVGTSAVILQGVSPIVAVSGWAGSVIRVATISLLFGALYLSAVILLHHGCAPLYQIKRLFRDMVPGCQETFKSAGFY